MVDIFCLEYPHYLVGWIYPSSGKLALQKILNFFLLLETLLRRKNGSKKLFYFDFLIISSYTKYSIFGTQFVGAKYFSHGSFFKVSEWVSRYEWHLLKCHETFLKKTNPIYREQSRNCQLSSPDGLAAPESFAFS